MKLVNFAQGDWALVEYGNERGVAETTMVFICGGKVYVPNFPNYQQWTASFRPLAEELGRQVLAQYEVHNAQAEGGSIVPSQDAVDVLGSVA
jgi:hypothetical protein